MIKCRIELEDDVSDLYKIFLSETLSSDRAECKVTKTDVLVFDIAAKDTVSMKAFVNSILKVIETYQKVKNG